MFFFVNIGNTLSLRKCECLSPNSSQYKVKQTIPRHSRYIGFLGGIVDIRSQSCQKGKTLVLNYSQDDISSW